MLSLAFTEYLLHAKTAQGDFVIINLTGIIVIFSSGKFILKSDSSNGNTRKAREKL